MHGLLALPVWMGGLGLVNLVNQSSQEYEAPSKQPPPCETAKDVASQQRCARQENADSARRDLEFVPKSLSLKIKRAVEFVKEKGASSWLSVIP